MTDRPATVDPQALLVLADPVPTLPTPDAEDVARVVRRAQATVPPPGSASTHRTRRRRFALAGGLVAVAVVATTAVVVLPQGGQLGVRPPAAAANPVTVLRAAAAGVADEPFTAPRPDQFVYVAGPGYRAWLSVDGAHDGLVDNGSALAVPGCRAGLQTSTGQDGRVHTGPCTPDPAYRPDLPSDPDALRAAIVGLAGGTETNVVAKQVLSLLEFDLVAPATRAALYTVISGYPGLSVRTGGVPAGTVGVAWSFGGGTMTLLFGSVDHTYRGTLDPSTGDVSPWQLPVVVDAVGQTG